MTRNAQGFLVWDDDFKNELLTKQEIAINDAFVKKMGVLIDKRKRGEITESEFNRLSIELDNEHTIECIRLYDAQAESEKCVAEFSKLLDLRDAGTLTDYEYRQRCFELDKKYGLATDEDYDFYFGDDDDDFEEVAESDSDDDSQLTARA